MTMVDSEQARKEQLAETVAPLVAANRIEFRGANLGMLVGSMREDLGIEWDEAAKAAGMEVDEWSEIEEGLCGDADDAFLNRVAPVIGLDDANELKHTLEPYLWPTTTDFYFAADQAVLADARLSDLMERVEAGHEVELGDLLDVWMLLHDSVKVLGEIRDHDAWDAEDDGDLDHIVVVEDGDEPGLRVVPPTD